MDKKFITAKKWVGVFSGLCAVYCLFLWLWAYPHDIKIAGIMLLSFMNLYFQIRDLQLTAQILRFYADDFRGLFESQNKLDKELQEHRVYKESIDKLITELEYESGQRDQELYRLRVFTTAIRELYKNKNN